MNGRTTVEVIELTGELDIARREELRNSFALPERARAVLLDFSNVTYADSTALTELLKFWDLARQEDVSLALVVGTPQFMRLVQFAGLEEAFHIFDDRGRALAYLTDGAS